MRKLFAPRDVARLAGVTTAAVQAWDRRGVFRATRDSAGRRFYEEDHVRAFLERRQARRQTSAATR
jgi:DNA-binding transcriptional MerR regulator